MEKKYNPYYDIAKIAEQKGLYEKGDTAQKQNAENTAKKYYENLRSNGFDGYANSLSKMNSGDAQKLSSALNPVSSATPYQAPVTSNYSRSQAKSDVNEIAWLKQVYTNGDDAQKSWAATEAQKYYSSLRNNGYGNVADSIERLNAGDAYNFSKGYVPDYNAREFANDYRANASKAIDNQFRAVADTYEMQKKGVNSSYDNANKAAHSAYINQMRSLPQQLAAQGISGGASESAQLKLANSYGQNVYNNELARARAISDIDAAISSARYNSEAQKANAENTYAQMALDIDRDTRDYYANERYKNASLDQNQRQIDFNEYYQQRILDNNARDFEYNKNVDERNFAYQAEADKRNFDYNRAVNDYQVASTLANMGYFGKLANLLGISEEDAKRLYQENVQFINDPNGLEAMITAYQVGKPYYKSGTAPKTTQTTNSSQTPTQEEKPNLSL